MKHSFAVHELWDGIAVDERVYGPEEKCKLCGRTMGVQSLTWHLRKSGTFGFQCVNELACKNARVKVFAKEHPEI